VLPNELESVALTSVCVCVCVRACVCVCACVRARACVNTFRAVLNFVRLCSGASPERRSGSSYLVFLNYTLCTDVNADSGLNIKGS
jgi:hypothetical protein